MRTGKGLKIFTSLTFGLVLLSGCTCLPRKYTPCQISWEQRQRKLQPIVNWTIEGALSITYHQQRDIARFKWTQTSKNYQLGISGPLNLHRLQLVGDSHGVRLCTPKKCVNAKTPEQLLLGYSGWRLPVSNLRYWIMSLPAPKTKIVAMELDQYGRLSQLHQHGWQINYSGFHLVPEKNLDLPRVIELTNQELVIKIKITQSHFTANPVE